MAAAASRSVRQYSMPTSTNHGSAYSAPFQRLASTAAGKKSVDRRMKAIEAAIHPAAANSGVQIDVELQHVGIGGARVQPLHVELMALVGGVRRPPARRREGCAR